MIDRDLAALWSRNKATTERAVRRKCSKISIGFYMFEIVWTIENLR
ncbi:MAG: hypothetical protein IPP46_06060 [Bacteroidetes bacterium]|nr:hypothetical protein [Bacteroidota bacterium]